MVRFLHHPLTRALVPSGRTDWRSDNTWSRRESDQVPSFPVYSPPVTRFVTVLSLSPLFTSTLGSGGTGNVSDPSEGTGLLLDFSGEVGGTGTSTVGGAGK